MAANPTTYCLENLTDYTQFESMSHDLMARCGYRNIEPLGGFADRGRDAIHVSQGGETTIFAYSVREDWRKKLKEDAGKLVSHGHKCDRMVFVTTSKVTASERDSAKAAIKRQYGWELDIYGLERLRIWLDGDCQDIKRNHPQIFDPRLTTEQSTLFEVPFSQNRYFTGRSDVLSDLRDALTKGGRAVLGQAISGLGGIGKTQTAVEYAYRHRRKYTVVLWIRADTVVAIMNGFVRIAKALHLRHDPANAEETVRAVKSWLERNPGWLLVFDSADHPRRLRPFLPRLATGHILLTSRASVFDALGIKSPLELSKMPTEEALAFLLHRTNRDDINATERAAARQLAHELDGLPLALEQAGAYILEMNVPFERYLKSYHDRRLELLEKRRPVTGEYPETVATTWAVNFQEVEKASKTSADVLRFSAFLSPDDIPFELLTTVALGLSPALSDAPCGADGIPLEFHEILEPLTRFSLIQIDAERDTYGIHRLVQEVLRDAMDADARRTWAERTVHALAQASPPVEYAKWPLWERLLPHAVAAAEFIKLHNLESQESAFLLDRSASFLKERGQYDEAEVLFEQAMDIQRTILGEHHPNFATSLNNLAAVYNSMGRFADAVPLYKQANAILGNTLGEHHPDFASGLNNLALLYHSLGRHAEAEPLFIQAMEIRRTALGDKDPHFAESLNGLAMLYESIGRYVEAEPLYRQAVEIRRVALGEAHPHYAMSLNNLAMFYRTVGRHAEAEPLLRQTVTAQRKALGEEHPDYANGLNNLGMLYVDMGRHAEAEPLLKHAIEIERTVLGEGHPHYAMSVNNLAMVYRSMGQHAQAKPLYEQALEIRRAALGESHPDYATSLNNLGMLYHSTGQHAEAEPLFIKAMKIRRTALGEHHRDFAESLNNLAGLYDSVGRRTEAEPLYKQALDILRTTLGKNHPHFAIALNNLAILYKVMGRYAEAEPLYRQATEILRVTFGERHPHFATGLKNLGMLYQAMGRPTEAEPLLEQARAIERMAIGGG